MENMNKNNQKVTHEKNQSHKGIMKHGLMMMLCCLIPILIIAGLPLFGIEGGFSSSSVFLLCPLMHIGMMFMMRKNGKESSCHSDNKSECVEVEEKK